jgi:hypothetical protein
MWPAALQARRRIRTRTAFIETSPVKSFVGREWLSFLAVPRPPVTRTMDKACLLQPAQPLGLDTGGQERRLTRPEYLWIKNKIVNQQEVSE